jgi:CRP-like cAMP-binding protein
VKNFNWKDLLGQHSLFESLDPKEVERIITHLLDDKVSEEREYSGGTIIVREGEPGASVFLVGRGSVQVVLEGENGAGIPIATLRQGELFGEMALLEKKPRAATVKAKESSILLEIKGQEFLKLLDEHKDVESKMLLKLSERLRHANDQVFAVRVRTLDEKIDALEAKHEAELKAVDAQLNAARAVFDQTKLRTDEIINSADRSRARLTTAVQVIAAVVVIVTTFLGWVGWSQFKDATALRNSQLKDTAEIKELAAHARKDVEEIKKTNENLQSISASLKEFTAFRKDFYRQVMVPRFGEDVEKDLELALRHYKLILETQDTLVSNELFRTLWAKILGNEDRRESYRHILEAGIKNNDVKTPRERFLSYYLLLIALILDDKQFGNTLKEFKGYAKEYKGESIRSMIKSDFGIDTFERFPKDKKTSIGMVWDLIP